MADEAKAPETPAPTRKDAIQAWHDCKTNEERAAALAKHQVLKEIFSPGEWSHLV